MQENNISHENYLRHSSTYITFLHIYSSTIFLYISSHFPPSYDMSLLLLFLRFAEKNIPKIYRIGKDGINVNGFDTLKMSETEFEFV